MKRKRGYAIYVVLTRLQGKYNGPESARYIHYATCKAFLTLVTGDDAATREFIHAFVGR